MLSFIRAAMVTMIETLRQRIGKAESRKGKVIDANGLFCEVEFRGWTLATI